MFHHHKHIQNPKSDGRHDAEVTCDDGVCVILKKRLTNADHREVSQPAWSAISADTYGSCVAISEDRVSAATRWQFALLPTTGSRAPACESDAGGAAESAAGRIGISNARRVGSPCGASG